MFGSFNSVGSTQSIDTTGVAPNPIFIPTDFYLDLQVGGLTQTSFGGATIKRVVLPFVKGGVICNVDWGDGTNEDIDVRYPNTNPPRHDYVTTTGRIRIRITAHSTQNNLVLPTIRCTHTMYTNLNAHTNFRKALRKVIIGSGFGRKYNSTAADISTIIFQNAFTRCDNLNAVIFRLSNDSITIAANETAPGNGDIIQTRNDSSCSFYKPQTNWKGAFLKCGNLVEDSTAFNDVVPMIQGLDQQDFSKCHTFQSMFQNCDPISQYYINPGSWDLNGLRAFSGTHRGLRHFLGKFNAAKNTCFNTRGQYNSLLTNLLTTAKSNRLVRNILVNAGTTKYDSTHAATRTELINKYGFSFIDGGQQ